MMITSEDAEREALLNIAKLMVVAARTAPKARGEDKIKAAIVIGNEKDELAFFHILTYAEMPLHENLQYVRAEVIDRQGRHAWTNPIILKKTS